MMLCSLNFIELPTKNTMKVKVLWVLQMAHLGGDGKSFFLFLGVVVFEVEEDATFKQHTRIWLRPLLSTYKY